MHLAASDLLSSLVLPTISDLQKGIPQTSVSVAPSSSGTGFFGSLLKALPAIANTGLQTFATIQQAKYLDRYGIAPSFASPNGAFYGATPSGVTPGNPYSLPSGSGLPVGVTPNFGFPQATLTLPPPQSGGITSFLQSNLPMILIGVAGLVVTIWATKK
ncbi:MAG: hypothetical protein KGJ13_05000 [Patescibacteria group bacterium]|nr:hypothetical protein [Patescibacteria group bacterium]